MDERIMNVDKRIEEIWFYCLANSCNPSRYQVGRNGVTEIRKESYSTEPYCGKEYFRVVAGDQWVADIYNPNEIYYFREQPPSGSI
jgi:hypothetical protein